MKIYTSYFNREKALNREGVFYVSVTRGSTPSWFLHKVVEMKRLAPSWGIVSGYKNGEISWDEYTKSYESEMCFSEKKADILAELMRMSEINDNKDPVLLCHCTGNCHRHIIAKELCGVEIL